MASGTPVTPSYKSKGTGFPNPPKGSNTGPFGIPPGGPWFVFPASGTIQRQSNPALAVGLANAGWVGFANKGDAQAYAKSNPARKVTQAPSKAVDSVFNWFGSLGGMIASGIESGVVNTLKDIWAVIEGPVEVLLGAAIAIFVLAIYFGSSDSGQSLIRGAAGAALAAA